MALFKRGNEKIHTNTAITCLPTSVCKVQCPSCYAKRPEIRFPTACLPELPVNIKSCLKDGYTVEVFHGKNKKLEVIK